MRGSIAAVAIAAALLGARAEAQSLELFGRDSSVSRHESVQAFALEIRGGPWYPSVDGEFGNGRHPFRDMFGSDQRVLLGLEFDWQALRLGPVGSLGLGVGWGYTGASAVSPLTESPMSSDPAQWSRPSDGQSTRLTVMPGYLIGVFRLDVLARRTVIPIVPYVKFGVSYAYWWVTNGDNLARRSLALSPGARATDTDLDQAATGLSLGTHLALGAMVRLDIFEPRAQRAWDLAMGVNHSYLFFEYVRSDTNGLGSRPQLHLGYESWSTGLAIEF